MNRYIYIHYASPYCDTVGDHRNLMLNGKTTTQQCTKSSDSKGGGDWIDIK